MDDDSGTWRVFTGDQLDVQPPEVKRQVEEGRRQVPLAELRVRVVGLERGECEVQLRIEPDGALGDAHGDGPRREAACARLQHILEEAVRDAVALLCLGGDGDRASTT